jgi:putative membrane protein
MGSVFTIYGSLSPSIFSIGGILLAIGLLFIAKIYSKILNVKAFFQISLGIEIVMLFMVGYFLISPYSYTTALLVYISYQISFMFGSYLVRGESAFFSRVKLLSFIDVAKQKGYLIGLAVSYIFYEVIKYLGVLDNQTQVYNLHFLLLAIEFLVIYYLILAFTFKR